MAYTTNPHLPKVRRDAVNLVKQKGWSIRKVAKHTGYNPSTITRWCKHPYASFDMPIPTESSRPKTHPHALSRDIVSKIITERNGRNRCAEHVHMALKRQGVVVSLSSVKRTLDRCHLTKKRSLWKRPHDYTQRPEVTHSGALMQLDTIHILLSTGEKLYVYTLIDLYSRWTYAEVSERISAHRSVLFIQRALKCASFKFEMIQTDHGPEFSCGFTHGLLKKGISHRHSRIRKPNDNAHIERFNRTIQEECLDRILHTIPVFKKEIPKYLNYYNTKRLHMGINFQTPQEVLQRS